MNIYDVDQWDNQRVQQWVAEALKNSNKSDSELIVQLLRELKWDGPDLLHSCSYGMGDYLQDSLDLAHRRRFKTQLPDRTDSLIRVKLAAAIRKLDFNGKLLLDEFEQSLENLPDETRLNKTKEFLSQLWGCYATQTMQDRVDTLPDITDFGRDINIPIISELLGDSEQQKQQLQEFNRPDVCLPYLRDRFGNSRLVMDLAPMNDKLWTEDVRQYVEDVEQNQFIDLLMRKSGEGKTAKLLGVGTRMHLIFIVAHDLEDSSFKSLEFKLASSSLSHVQRLLVTRYHVRLFLAARLLHLYVLLKQDISPIDFLASQFSFQYLLSDIYEKVCEQYGNLSEDALLELCRNIVDQMKGKKIGLVIDEASTGPKLNPKLLSQYGKVGSLMSIFAEELANLNLHYRAFAGRSALLFGTITSSIGKQGLPLRINNVPYTGSVITFPDCADLNTPQDVERYLRMHVNLDGCDEDSLSSLACLVGRKRITANVVHNLPMQQNGSSKSEILKNCVSASYDLMLNHMCGNILQKTRRDEPLYATVLDLVVSQGLDSDTEQFTTDIDMLRLGVAEISAIREESSIDPELSDTLNLDKNSNQPVLQADQTETATKKRKRFSHRIQTNAKRPRTEYTLSRMTEPVVFGAFVNVGKRLLWSESPLLSEALQKFPNTTTNK